MGNGPWAGDAIVGYTGSTAIIIAIETTLLLWFMIGFTIPMWAASLSLFFTMVTNIYSVDL
jgi:hypothetical protein